MARALKCSTDPAAYEAPSVSVKVYGAAVDVETFTPSTKNETEATPTLSPAVAESAMVLPTNACSGAVKSTVGGVVSAADTAVIDTTPLASAELPLKSVARTVMPSDEFAGASAGIG